MCLMSGRTLGKTALVTVTGMVGSSLTWSSERSSLSEAFRTFQLVSVWFWSDSPLSSSSSSWNSRNSGMFGLKWSAVEMHPSSSPSLPSSSFSQATKDLSEFFRYVSMIWSRFCTYCDRCSSSSSSILDSSRYALSSSKKKSSWLPIRSSSRLPAFFATAQSVWTLKMVILMSFAAIPLKRFFARSTRSVLARKGEIDPRQLLAVRLMAVEPLLRNSGQRRVPNVLLTSSLLATFSARSAACLMVCEYFLRTEWRMSRLCSMAGSEASRLVM